MAREPGAMRKIEAFLIENVGKVIESQELFEISGGRLQWGRRLRDLRARGMNIATHNDRSDLKPGQYMLVDLKPLPSFDGAISKKTRAYVLDRNGFTCQMCGAVAGEPHPYDGRRTRLHIGHIVDRSMGGTDDYANLRALCSVCNEGAANITLDRPTSAKLLAQIRRAPGSEQLIVLDWLIKKFPRQAEEAVKSK